MKFSTKLASALVLSGLSFFAQAQITVSDAYAREIPPGAPASASFMQLSNDSDQAVKLVSASSNAAEIVELHTHSNDNGIMRMRKIDAIEIPANGSVTLQPGGLHIMLIEPDTQLKAGQNISLTLKFSDNSEQTLEIPVKSMRPMMHHNHDEHHNH